MIPKYPVPSKYKINQSQVRYKYSKPQKIIQKAQKYRNSFKSLSKFHDVQSDLVIDGLEYFVNITKQWDTKSKQINGWTSCYLTIKTLHDILNGFKKKYGYFSKSVKFANIEAIYQISNINNLKIWPLNNLVFGLLIAIEEHPKHSDFHELQDIIEVIAQSQVLYHIANYQYRKNRRYQLPWERIDDPVIPYRKKYNNKREKIIKIRRNVIPDQQQSKIKDFFQQTSSTLPIPQILDSDDDEILAILEELDNGECAYD